MQRGNGFSVLASVSGCFIRCQILVDCHVIMSTYTLYFVGMIPCMVVPVLIIYIFCTNSSVFVHVVYDRYCADNPGLFKNADTAYVLAYAVIMLNTDAHNPMVWPKMSKSDFVRMNARDDPDECAPKELLEEIYDSIVKEEIKMKDDTSLIGKSSRQKPEGEEGRLVSILNLALPKRKSSGDAKSESEDIIKKTQAIFRNKGVKRGVFYTAQQIELVRPMVEAVGWPLLATFSVTMEEGENKSRVVLLMEGFKAGIHITFVLGMDTMRYAFLTSLVRYMFL